MILFIILTVLFLGTTIYFAYRAYILAGLLTDSEDDFEGITNSNQYMYERIVRTYNAMKRIDRLGAFEKDDEAGTTFQMLQQVIEELKEEFDAPEKEEE